MIMENGLRTSLHSLCIVDVNLNNKLCLASHGYGQTMLHNTKIDHWVHTRKRVPESRCGNRKRSRSIIVLGDFTLSGTEFQRVGAAIERDQDPLQYWVTSHYQGVSSKE